MFAALHTYGRQLNFNCHIYLSLAEYGLNKQGELKTFTFPFKNLMSMWRFGVIDLLRDNVEKLTFPESVKGVISNRQEWRRYLNTQYNRHKALTLTQEEMLLRLLSHIPEKYFKMVRYYGFLSNKLRGSMLSVIYEQLDQTLSLIKPLSFAAMMKVMMNVDPYQCILCGCRMTFRWFEKGMPLISLILNIKNRALQKWINC